MIAKRIGWEYVHVCVDDATRIAFAEISDNERGEAAADFLRTVVARLAQQQVIVESVLTDNGSCYRSDAFTVACRELGLRYLRTRPYRPRTNGKAERFIKTLVDRWAYAQVYGSSLKHEQALRPWLDFYKSPTTTRQPQPPNATSTARRAHG